MPAPLPPVLTATTYALPAGTYTYTSPCGLFHMTLDTEAYDFHVDASELLDPLELRAYLDAIPFAYGYELIAEDECEPLDLGDGMTRIYMTPLMPTPDVDLDCLPAVPVHETHRWAGIPSISILSGLGVAALAAIYQAVYHIGPALEVFS